VDSRVIPAAPPPDSGAAAAEALTRRLEQVLSSLRGRGVLEQDLPGSVSKGVRSIRREIRGGHLERARAALVSLERAARGLRVDRALVEVKLKRVHKLLRSRRGPALKGLRERESQALQEFMDGRHVSANRHLNHIIEKLGR